MTTSPCLYRVYSTNNNIYNFKLLTHSDLGGRSLSNQMVNYNQKVREMDVSQRLIIYCLGASNKPVGNKVDIQKILFLTSKELPDLFKDVFTFQKYKKGPYSERIDEDVAVISNSGYITGGEFGLSDEGYELFQEIEKRVKEPLKSSIVDNKEFVYGLTEEELLTFIYVIFPEYTENSEVWDKIKHNRVKNAVSLLKKEKITASQAAIIAGMNYYEFEDHLNKLKIRWKS